MADWPELAELKQIVNVSSDVWDGDEDNTFFTRALAAAIRRVKADIAGTPDAFDEVIAEPDDNLAQAALRMAELIVVRPGEPEGSLARDATYQTLLYGQRRVFGVA
jgi:hypothetical protein